MSAFKKHNILLIKTAVTIYFFYLIFQKIGYGSLDFRQPNWFYLWGSLAIPYVNLILISFRWNMMIKAFFKATSFWDIVKLQFLSSFLNQIIPTGLGGDIYKVHQLKKSNLTLLNGVAFVGLERGWGLLVLMFISALSSTILIFKYKLTSSLLISYLAFSMLIILLIGILLRYHRVILRPLTSFLKMYAIFDSFFSVVESFRFISTSIQTSKLNLFLICALVHLLNMIMLFSISALLNIKLPFTSLFIFPIVLLLSSLPVSIAGWGLRETLMITGLSLVDVPSSDAFLLSVAFGTIWLLCYLPIIPFIYKKRSFLPRL